MKYKSIPSQSVLQEIIHYNPETGKLFWKRRPLKYFKTPSSHHRWNAKHADKEAFTSLSHGYHQGIIFRQRYLAHRVIWKLVTGLDPCDIDHINRNPSDNRIANLRQLSRSENNHNTDGRQDNTSGVRGVFWEKGCKKWRVQIRINGKSHHVGVFDSLQDAKTARETVFKQYFPSLANGG